MANVKILSDVIKKYRFWASQMLKIRGFCLKIWFLQNLCNSLNINELTKKLTC